MSGWSSGESWGADGGGSSGGRWDTQPQPPPPDGGGLSFGDWFAQQAPQAPPPPPPEEPYGGQAAAQWSGWGGGGWNRGGCSGGGGGFPDPTKGKGKGKDYGKRDKGDKGDGKRDRSRSPVIGKRRGNESCYAIDSTICTKFIRGCCARGDKCPKKHVGDANSDTPFHGYIKSIDPDKGYGYVACFETFQAYGRDMYVHRDKIADLQVGQEVTFAVFVNDKAQTQATALVAETNGTKARALVAEAGLDQGELVIGEKVEVDISGCWFVGKVQSKDAKGIKVHCDLDEMDLKRRSKNAPSAKTQLDVARNGQTFKGIVMACVKIIPYGYKVVVNIEDAKSSSI